MNFQLYRFAARIAWHLRLVERPCKEAGPDWIALQWYWKSHPVQAFLITPEYFKNADGSDVIAAQATKPADSGWGDGQELNELLEGLGDD